MTGLWLIGYWAAPNLPLLAVCAVLQAGRLWVILSLGDRWTTKIIVVPGEPLVTAGPYRFLRHPNYAIVMAEIVVWPLMFGQPLFAAIFALINGAILLVRIRAEERALGEPRS